MKNMKITKGFSALLVTALVTTIAVVTPSAAQANTTCTKEVFAP